MIEDRDRLRIHVADFDDIDDLFEPFELTDESPTVDVADAPMAPPVSAVRPVSCPSCGTANHPDERNCVECGARVSKGPMPVAPQPMVRTTAGTRALIVMASVIVIVALLALLWNVIAGDETPTANPDDGSSASTSTSTTAVISSQATLITPSRVNANSQLEDFPAANLIDADPSTEWQDRGLAGQGATLTFFFDETVAIESIEFFNLSDPTRFKRNYRIEGIRVAFDDGNFTSAILDDRSGSQVVPVTTVGTNRVVIDITSTYPGEPVGDQLPFDELALADVQFVGRIVAPAAN
ncbi:MAG: zinc ribbon domain-containing protein [Acidimicrobiia bacterium]|nr:zinc ribbon domain-containing protein [Acidimicrobiia bacterium]